MLHNRKGTNRSKSVAIFFPKNNLFYEKNIAWGNKGLSLIQEHQSANWVTSTDKIKTWRIGNYSSITLATLHNLMK
jgi:hypothetical protein